MDDDIGAALIAQGIDAKLWTEIQQLDNAKHLVEEGKLKPEIYSELKARVINNITKKQTRSKSDKRKVNKLQTFASFFQRNEPEKQKVNKSASIPDERPILENELLMSYSKGNKRIWKKRYCVLYEHALILYSKKGEKKPAGSIILNGEWFASESKNTNAEDDSFDSDDEDSTSHASSLKNIDTTQPHQFILSDLNTKHRFAAETEELAMLWVRTLTAVLRALYKKEEGGLEEPTFLDKASRSPEQIQKDFEQRVEAYKKSQRKHTLMKMKKDGLKVDERQLKEEEARWEVEGNRAARKSMFVDLHNDELEQARRLLDEQKREADLAKKEAEKLKEELEREHEIVKQKDQQILSLEGLMSKLREEAEQRRQEKIKEVASTESKLTNLANMRRASVRRGETNFDEEAYKKEIEALKGKLKALQSQLNVDYESLDWDGTLEQAELKMKELMPKMMSENEKEQQEAQRLFDQWDQIIRSHKDYQERETKKWEQWEAENYEKNLDALNEMKKLAPAKVMQNCTIDDLVKDGLMRKTAKRVLAIKAFHFFWMPKDKIAKTHIADLYGRYAVMNFDLRELRALYAALPTEFQLDADGRKNQYRLQIRNKLFELTEKEKNGTLAPAEELNNAYRTKAVNGPKSKPAAGGPPKVKKVEMNAKTAALAAMLAQRLGGTDGEKLPPNHEKWKKYLKMKKTGLPEGAIMNCMKKDGVDSSGWGAAQKAAGMDDGGGSSAPENTSSTSNTSTSPTPTPVVPTPMNLGNNGSKRPSRRGEQMQVSNIPPNTRSKANLQQTAMTNSAKFRRAPSVDTDKPLSGMLANFVNLVTGPVEEEQQSQEIHSHAIHSHEMHSHEHQNQREVSVIPQEQLEKKTTVRRKSSKKEDPALRKLKNRDPNAPLLAAGTNELVSQAENEFSDIKLETSVQAVQFDEYGGKMKKSTERAMKIGNKIEQSLDELIEIIKEYGEYDETQGGQATITFGELFDRYEKINDMLVGLLYKGKRKKRIKYKGDMLFKGIHDAIKITAL